MQGCCWLHVSSYILSVNCLILTIHEGWHLDILYLYLTSCENPYHYSIRACQLFHWKTANMSASYSHLTLRNDIFFRNKSKESTILQQTRQWLNISNCMWKKSYLYKSNQSYNGSDWVTGQHESKEGINGKTGA